MNGTEEIIKYGDFHNSYHSPTVNRRTAFSSYDLPDKSPKKDKKWSLGNLFRRKKKTVSESSSEDESQKKGFLQKKRKDKRKKSTKNVGTFDHVVLSPTTRNSFYPANRPEDVLSDPSMSYSSFSNRTLPKVPSENDRLHVINTKESRNSPSLVHGSADSINKKLRREQTKAKVEAQRKYGSSSDEDSQRSLSSSRLRSDDSSSRLQREGSLSRRSRAARTERYMKRHSKDEENFNQLRTSKSDAEARYLGYYNDHNNYLKRPLPRSPVNVTRYKSKTQSELSGTSTIPPSHVNKYRISSASSNSSLKAPVSINEYNNQTKNYNYDNQRSISYDGIHKKSPEVHHRQLKYVPSNNSVNDVYNGRQRQPPPPPPRDPRRLMQYFDTGRPTSYSFENSYHPKNGKSKSFHRPHVGEVNFETTRAKSFNYRSTSEDQLPIQPILHDQLIPRPSSATPDVSDQQKHLRKFPEVAENYNYLTDKNPRSRKPIFIQQSKENIDDSQKLLSHKSAEFWRQKDQEQLSKVERQKSKSPQIFTSKTHVSTKVFLPSVTKERSPLPSEGKDEVDQAPKTGLTKQKSTNLEEALDELEAIYNSLHLGDEDLLERAEEREKSVAEKKLQDMKNEQYPSSLSRGTMSDSSYSYESLDGLDASRRKRNLRRSRAVDIKADDMAFRKLNKEKSPVKDPQKVISKVSYLLASPVYNSFNAEAEEHKVKSKEPDVTFDDVVYRNIKHANNSLKIAEPQPPFGIPLGPVTPAANSDYLHAVSERTERPLFKPRKIPNIVNDDLAFRNLRKDGNKEPALPPVSAEDFVNKNNVYNKNLLKKNRAIRSLSANIFNMVDSGDEVNEFEKTTLDDIADAMEIARQVLRDKENRINSTKRGFLSDTEATKLQQPKSFGPASSKTLNSRNSFLNQMRFGLETNCDKEDNVQKLQIRVPLLGDDFLHTKPPRGLTPERKVRSPTKESTPIPLSHFEQSFSNESVHTSFDDILAALAMEAKETSDRITSELNQLVEGKEEPKVSLDIKKEMSDIDAVSERAKLCDKLLENEVESKDLEKEPVEEVPETVVSTAKVEEECKPEDHSESEHDYENMESEKEDIKEVVEEEQEAEHPDRSGDTAKETSSDPEDVADNSVEGAGGKAGHANINTPRPTKWLKSRRYRNLSDPITMSENQAAKAERIARYKEERRAQLAAQYGSLQNEVVAARRKENNSSSSEGPRQTRTSRLRAAATQDNGGGGGASPLRVEPGESNSSMAQRYNLRQRPARPLERDKSSKRKSNLNRSLTSEEVPDTDTVESRAQRRRRRLLAPPVHTPSASNDLKTKSDSCLTASSVSPISPSSPITAARPNNNKKSELGMHMENARRGMVPSYSEMGRQRVTPPRSAAPIISSSPKLVRLPKLGRSTESNICDIRDSRVKVANKENIIKNSESKKEENYVSFSKKMDELTAFAKESLARIEQLQNRDKKAPNPKDRRKQSFDNKRTYGKVTTRSDAESSDSSRPSSILKKKSIEEIVVEPIMLPNLAPVSILKRKGLQDESRTENCSYTNTPVTFSPSVVEPASTNRKQGILKKRRSLDESQVLRHRSFSPETAMNNDSRSILKNKRRSSLEEITRVQSPDPHIQGILKRKPSRQEDDVSHSLNSPQGILKRRSGSNSAGSTGATQHVSIATAVILAAAGGAEIVLDSAGETVKPILKKKSFSEEHPYSDSLSHDHPKPILKKKSSTDTDDSEERPKKPILKIHRNSSENSDMTCDIKPLKHIYHQNSSDSSSERERDVRPILKQIFKDDHQRRKLKFSAARTPEPEDVKPRVSRRPNTICGDFHMLDKCVSYGSEDRDLNKPRPLSVSELVMSFEKKPVGASTGAVPKKSSLKRSGDRYRTQPVTYNELEASRKFIQSPSVEELRTQALSNTSYPTAHKLFPLSSTPDNDSSEILNGTIASISPDSGFSHKLSSDSAFQSLGECLELEPEQASPPPVKTKMDQAKLHLQQMKAIAEEAKKRRLGRGPQEVSKFNLKNTERSGNRFATQPVTVDEVQEAARLNKKDEGDHDAEEEEPSNLSLSERIKMFNSKMSEQRTFKREVPRRKLNRFQTQPVTSDEVETALYISPITPALDSSSVLENDTCSTNAGRKGILKSRRESREAPKSALKRSGSDASRFSPRPILKNDPSDFANDEGISSNESASDSSDGEEGGARKSALDSGDKFGVMFRGVVEPELSDRRSRFYGADDGTHTSDGESSGGREVQSIINSSATRLRVKDRPPNDYFISKSKSQSAFVRNEVTGQKFSGFGIQRSSTASAMAIAELQAKLQRSGESEWRKRHLKINSTSEELKNLYNDEKHSEKLSILAKKDELDASSQRWRSRVEKKDAEQFTVIGRMQEDSDVPNLNISASDATKRTPSFRRFRGKEDVSSMPTSPSADHLSVKRSFSVPGSKENQNSDGLVTSAKKVTVIRPDDDTFKTFFKSVDDKKSSETMTISLDDLDFVTRGTTSLLVQKKNVRVQRRRGASRNPVKTLSSNIEIQTEYTEVMSGAGEREARRLNIAKLQKTSNMAIEALAGLASTEDFASVALKKNSGPSLHLPHRNLMLLQVKGRRHIQTRLVEPVASSINQGDNYILVTPNALYNYVGRYSNIIEQSRAADIVSHILQKRDLGCKTDKIILLQERNSSCSQDDFSSFWELLGADEDESVGAGHPDEDELYESRIIDTNMIYQVRDNELVPCSEYWGAIPKVKMLETSKVLVFDFGSEMYVWSGKMADPEEKKLALKLAQEMWDEGFNYSECSVCPINVSQLLGNRPEKTLDFKANDRPKWALFAKLTQHAETILFKEKFLDWPDYTRVIKVKSNDKEDEDKTVDPSYDLQPCNVKEMLDNKYTEPDFIVESTHLGRGDKYFDEETRRLFDFNTLDITAWRILENSYEKLGERSLGQFYDGDSYILRWRFRMTVMGRELSGKPSKYSQSGRDRYIYFCWQGVNASTNEKGAAALLTVELDSENAPQVRVTQSSEPTVFLKLFEGSMVVHMGKRDSSDAPAKDRLYIIRGEVEDEVFLTEVPCSMRQLRSRTSFLLVNAKTNLVTIWHGCKSTEHTRKIAKGAVDRIMENGPSEMGFSRVKDISVNEISEGHESDSFKNVLGQKSELYFSLVKSKRDYDWCLRLFHLSSTLGSFKSVELFCPHRSKDHVCPYPFLQSDLYSASQPAIFMIDNGFELWLWQGWWPEREDEVDTSDQTGSGAIRWQCERRAAMQTAVNYWREKRGTAEKSVPAYLVWAGLEPLEFTNLFPTWNNEDGIAELNIKEGKKAGDYVLVEKELAILTRSTYPLSQLQQRPLPEGVDPTHLEMYLSSEDFEDSFSMTKEEFGKLPNWRQTDLKKENGLF